MCELCLQAQDDEAAGRFAAAADHWEQRLNCSDTQLAQAGCADRRLLQLRWAGAAYQCGDCQRAKQVLAGLDRSDPQVLRMLTRVCLELEEAQEAADAAMALLEVNPDDVAIKRALGRAFISLGEAAPVAGQALYWQRAIEQFSDILTIYNPHDELARDWKLDCVKRRDVSFDETMQQQWLRFKDLYTSRADAAEQALAELAHMAVEHAVDILQQKPQHTAEIAHRLAAWVKDFSAGHAVDLADHMGNVLPMLHCLAMWAHVTEEDFGRAGQALQAAFDLSPDGVLPLTSRAMLASIRRDAGTADAAMSEAGRQAVSAHDQLRVAVAFHALGELDKAMDWVLRVDVERLKSEAYRPDRAVPMLKRFMAEIEADQQAGREREMSQFFSGELNELVKRMLDGSARTTH